MGSNTFVTSAGRELAVVEISLIMLEKIRESIQQRYLADGKVLEPPMYCVELPGNNKQCYPHDADTIQEGSTADEERQMWERYVRDLQAFNTELAEKMMGAAFIDQPIEEEEGWERKLEWLDIPVEEHEFDRKIQYITTCVLKTPEDFQGYFTAIIKASGGEVDRGAVEAARRTFPSTP